MASVGIESDPDTDQKQEGGTDTVLDVSVIFELLATRRRRLLVEQLDEYRDQEETLTLPAAARAVAEREAADTDDDPDDLYQTIYVGLYQMHIPALEDIGLVDFDPESKRVEPRGDFDRVARIARVARVA